MSRPPSTGASGSRPSPSTSTSTASSSAAPKAGSYVPPHMRGKVVAGASAGTASSGKDSSARAPATDSMFANRSRSDEPRSRSDPARPSQGTYQHPSRRFEYTQPQAHTSFPVSQPPSSHRGTPAQWQATSSRNVSAPPHDLRSSYLPNSRSNHYGFSSKRSLTTSTLFISGDSFVGALSPALGPRPDDVAKDPSLRPQMEEAARWKRVVVDKGKGASAKGLNNPNSTKGHGPKVLEFALEAFPQTHNYFDKPRFLMLMYGNVDLNINYLWQLRNRPLVPSSFTPEELEQVDGPFVAFTNHVPVEEKDGTRATHTDNDARAHAHGPKKFVDKSAKEYISFLEREIVNGPVGRLLKDLAAESKSVHHRGGGPSKSRLLIAGALPPMVRDPHLYRLQAKYVDQHADNPPKSPPRPRPVKLATRPEDLRLGSLSLQDSPRSSTSSASSRGTDSRTLFENDMSGSVHSSVSSNPINEESELEAITEEETELPAKKTFESMLKQSPAICTLPIRVDMVDEFNAQLRAFCALHPDVLQYIEINDSMRQAHPDPLIDTSPTVPFTLNGNGVDGVESEDSGSMVKGSSIIQYYASAADGDGANVHPTWERTYPLWLVELRKAGVDVDTFPKVDTDELERKLREYTEEKGDRLLGSKYRTPV